MCKLSAVGSAPQYVLSVSTIKDETTILQTIKYEGYFYDFDSLKGMQKSITQLGDQFDRKAQAKELNDHLNSVKQKLKIKQLNKRNIPKY